MSHLSVQPFNQRVEGAGGGDENPLPIHHSQLSSNEDDKDEKIAVLAGRYSSIKVITARQAAEGGGIFSPGCINYISPHCLSMGMGKKCGIPPALNLPPFPGSVLSKKC